MNKWIKSGAGHQVFSGSSSAVTDSFWDKSHYEATFKVSTAALRAQGPLSQRSHYAVSLLQRPPTVGDRCLCWGQMSQSWRETEWRRISSWVPGMPRELQGTRSRGNTSHRNQSGHQRVLLGPQLQRRCQQPWLQRLAKWWGEMVFSDQNWCLKITANEGLEMS